MKRIPLICITFLVAITACRHTDSTNPDSEPTDTIRRAQPLKISPKVGNLSRQFNDLNDAHLQAAAPIAIRPINSHRDIINLSRPIVKIDSCDEFVLDRLTHSYPYLVPEAAELLHDIGRQFTDSLLSRGGGDYRILVTSLLRTEESVGRLSRRNINSTKQSAHLLGTTFDISYVRFPLPADTTSVVRTDGDLKNLLAEILLNLRQQGRCLVKYERKQGCFHITATPI